MSTPSAPSHPPPHPVPPRTRANDGSRRGIGWLLIMLVTAPMFATPFVIAAIVLLTR